MPSLAAASDRAGGESTSNARWLFGLFAFLFAVSLVLHQVRWFGFEVLSPHLAPVLAALWVTLRPTSVARFATMIAAETVAVGIDMPNVGSHTLLVFVTGACLLTYLAASAWRTRRPPEAGALFEGIAPFLRVQLLLVYLAAAFAKMNTGFFDPERSCAVALSGQIAWIDPALLDGAWRIAPAIWGTVGVELALPLLLAFSRTRLLGLALGTAFHTVLALAGNVPFSALVLALYVAFLPTDVPDRLRALGARRPAVARWARRIRRVARGHAAFPALAALWLLAAAAASAWPAAVGTAIANGTRVAVVAIVLASVAAFLLCRGEGGPWRFPRRSLRLGHPVFAVGIALLALNSVSPYIGLKTDSSFTMFSNLGTEAGRWNHALLPEAVRVFGYQDELIGVTRSNDPALRRRSAAGSRIVRFEYERYLRSHPSVRASYVTDAGTGETLPTASEPLPASPARSALEKLVKFRDVRATERQGC